jgi:hypothetical protein
MDFVRLETASALKRDIPVVPVLVRGARMPRAEQLPEDLAELAYRNGVELTHARWDSDVQMLIKALSPYVESLQTSAGRVKVAGPAKAPQRAEADRVAAENANAIESAKLERTRQAATQRARWPSYNFPPPNGGLLVYTIMPDGNPACASYDGGGCLWNQTYEQIDFRRLRPLVCGAPHRARWGVTGYENPKHWCTLARRMRADLR